MAREVPPVSRRQESPAHAVAAAAAIGAGIGFSVASFLLGAIFFRALPAIVLENRLPVPGRLLFAGFVVGLTAIGAAAPLLASARRGAADCQALLRRLPSLRPLWGLFLLPVLFHPQIGFAAPLLTYFLALLLAVLVAACLPAGAARPEGASPRWPAALTLGLAAVWVVYVARHTILRHYSIESHAYDLGIMENVFWNSVNGHLFGSSIEPAGNHLGVHSSYVYALFFPLYALLPHTETLLVLQALVLGLAAWPLFLCARIHLGSGGRGALVAGLYLAHPGVAGAAFYDYHELSFAPLLLFSAWYFRLRRRWLPFWLAVAALLAVKEDMAIVVALLGATFLLGRRREAGVRLVAVGVVCYLVNTRWVIPYFDAHGGRDYTRYYQDLIPAGEGPASLLITILTHPIFVLRYLATPERLLFFLQIFAPLAFLCFLTWRGSLLVSYGLGATILASRPELHRLGFQYALLLVPFAALGLLIALEGRRRPFVTRGLAAAAVLSLVTCYHYGMIFPRHHFTAGYSTYDFDYDAEDRENRRSVLALAARIPPDASVLAAEKLVPHVARRRRVQTARLHPPSAAFDYLFYQRIELPPSAQFPGYQLVGETGCCILLRRDPGD